MATSLNAASSQAPAAEAAASSDAGAAASSATGAAALAGLDAGAPGPACLAWPDLSLAEACARLEPAEMAGATVLSLTLDPSALTLAALLDALARVAQALFPAWLPEAAALGGAQDGAAAALHGLVRRTPELRGDGLAPLAEALALAALHNRPPALEGFAEESRCDGCCRLIRASYGGAPLIFLIGLPPVPAGAVERLEHAIAWLAGRGVLVLRLAGPGAAALARVPREEAIAGTRPAATATATGTAAPVSPAGAATVAAITPLPGRPCPTSATELAMERHLATCPWAAERRWNAPWTPGPLAAPIRVDLMFAAARLVVELDGPDHLLAAKYAADRQRDRRLAASGLTVLRFTNAEVAADIARVAAEIRAFVHPQPREVS